MSDRHERFAGKNAALSRVWAGDSKEKAKAKRPDGPRIAICEQCKVEKEVRSYRMQQNDRAEGVASYGITYKLLCEACKPAPKVRKEEVTVSDKDIRSLLRGARKNLR